MKFMYFFVTGEAPKLLYIGLIWLCLKFYTMLVFWKIWWLFGIYFIYLYWRTLLFSYPFCFWTVFIWLWTVLWAYFLFKLQLKGFLAVYFWSGGEWLTLEAFSWVTIENFLLPSETALGRFWSSNPFAKSLAVILLWRLNFPSLRM